MRPIASRAPSSTTSAASPRRSLSRHVASTKVHATCFTCSREDSSRDGRTRCRGVPHARGGGDVHAWKGGVAKRHEATRARAPPWRERTVGAGADTVPSEDGHAARGRGMRHDARGRCPVRHPIVPDAPASFLRTTSRFLRLHVCEATRARRQRASHRVSDALPTLRDDLFTRTCDRRVQFARYVRRRRRITAVHATRQTLLRSPRTCNVARRRCASWSSDVERRAEGNT